MDSLAEGNNCRECLNYNFFDQLTPSDFLLSNDPSGCSTDIDFSSIVGDGKNGGDSSGVMLNQENECTRKRVRTDACSRRGTKACREKMRRERLNDRFLDLSSVLEPGRPVRADKPAILDDAIRLVNNLRNEAEELKETNEKLLEEIKSLKAEKNELRAEKLVLKADKERMEQQLKAISVSPPGFVQAHTAGYHAVPSKMAVYPGYSLIPMWQYLPPAASDTSRDHELRPPAA